eukprot:11636539-Alexandrium_andersonii.AAC.1
MRLQCIFSAEVFSPPRRGRAIVLRYLRRNALCARGLQLIRALPRAQAASLCTFLFAACCAFATAPHRPARFGTLRRALEAF